MNIQTRTDSELVVTSPHTDQVLIYDIHSPDDIPPGNFDWNTGDYPYIPAPLKTLDLLPGSQPTAIDAGLTPRSSQDPTLVSKAFVINSGKQPSGDTYDSFSVVNINGSGSSVEAYDVSLGEGSEPVSVAVKSDGKHVYFNVYGLNQVKWAFTVDPYDPQPIKADQNLDAIIENPIDIALGEIFGSGRDYILAVYRMVDLFPYSTFTPPAETSKVNLLAAIQAIIDCYETYPTQLSQCIGLLVAAKNEAEIELASDYYENAVLERLDHAIEEIQTDNIKEGQPETYLVFLETILQSIPLSAFGSPSSRQTALTLVQQAIDQIDAKNYDSAMEKVNELKSLIEDQLQGTVFYSSIRDLIDGVQASIQAIFAKFSESASEFTSMETIITDLPNTAFNNNGARQSLMNHIDQARSDCVNHRLDQALQKSDQVKSDIPSKIEDVDARAILMDDADHVLGILQSIGH